VIVIFPVTNSYSLNTICPSWTTWAPKWNIKQKGVEKPKLGWTFPRTSNWSANF